MGLLMARKMYNTKSVTTKPAAANVGGGEMQFAVIRSIKLSCITFVCVSRTDSTAALDRLNIFKYSPITVHEIVQQKCGSMYLFLSHVAKATV